MQVENSLAVVIAAYNASNFIHLALNSLLNQTIPPDEIIVVDDGSIDNTYDIINRYFPQVNLISQSNSGPAAARNVGVLSANSEFISFLDADDEWANDTVEVLKNAILSCPRPNFIVGNYCIKYWNNKGVNSVFGKVNNALDSFSERKINIWTGAVCIKKDRFLSVGGFNRDLRNGEDIDLWLRLLVSENCVYSVPNILAKYNFINLDSITSRYNEISFSQKNKFANMLLRDDRIPTNMKEAIKNYFYRFYLWEYLACLIKRDFNSLKLINNFLASFQIKRITVVSIFPILVKIIKDKLK